jgi:hypothetical protein
MAQPEGLLPSLVGQLEGGRRWPNRRPPDSDVVQPMTD